MASRHGGSFLLVTSGAARSARRARKGPARPPYLPRPEQEEARARWEARVSEAAPHLAAVARVLMARLTPDRWALEWSLPYWLGQMLGLERDAWLNLVASNVLGLGFVRLQDDLVDGEIAEPSTGEGAPSRVAAILLSTTLHHLWTGSLREMLGADRLFWSWFDACLAQWQAATWASLSAPAAPFREFGPAEFAALGHRGAPLKVCVAGACLLGGQVERIPPIAAAVDDLLTGAVLLDQAHDWEEDLAQGRANIFVSYALGASPQGPNGVSHASVRAALLAGEGAAPYFATARAYLAAAAGKAGCSGFQPLSEYASWVEAQAAALDRELRRRVLAAYDAAGARLRLGMASGDGNAG